MNLNKIVADCNPFELPCTPYKNRLDCLPHRSGIYFVCHSPEILYVGQSININSRWYSHSVRQHLNKDEVIISWLELPYELPLLNVVEWAFILKFKPLFNLNTPRLRQLAAAKEKEFQTKNLRFSTSSHTIRSVQAVNGRNKSMNDSVQVVNELDESVHSVKAMADGRRSTAELQSRYGLGSRTTLINRMKELGIEPYKEGKAVYVTEDAVFALDALNECLKRPGATMADCAATIKQQIDNGFSLEPIESSHPVQAVNGSELATQNNAGLFNLLETMVHSIDNLASQFAAKSDPFDNYEQLERFAQKGWAIPTNQLLPLLGRKSIPKLDDHNRFNSHGFTFWKSGKISNEYGWRVTKQQV